MSLNYDLISIVLLSISLIIISLWGFIIVSKKYILANLLILLNGIQIYSIDLGFAFKPYMVFSIILIFAVWIQRNSKERTYELIKLIRPITIPLLCFVISMLVSGILTGIAIQSVRHYILIGWNYLIVLIYLNCIINDEKLLKTNGFIIHVGLTMSIVGIISMFLYLIGYEGIATDRWGYGLLYRTVTDEFARLRNFELDPNAFALYLLPILFQSVGYSLYCKQRRTRIIYASLVTILVLITIMMTASRGAIVSILVTSIFIIIYYEWKLSIRIALALLLMSIAILIFQLTPAYEYLYSSYTFRKGIYESRIVLWSDVLNLISDNIMWGIGQGQLVKYTNFQAHNTWLELLVENGIFTFIFMVIVLTIVLKRGIYLMKILLDMSIKEGYLLMGGLAGLLSMIIMMFSISLISVIYFWFQIGLVMAMTYSYSKIVKKVATD